MQYVVPQPRTGLNKEDTNTEHSYLHHVSKHITIEVRDVTCNSCIIFDTNVNNTPTQLTWMQRYKN
ncbi:hypothetical protein MtrunA17_Chr2g0309531 [Medicago truncatula]|uniref:Uncharacterized protein n=1 Tax=Medicago truncatula TaxID=3880 RepID=A0A396J7Y7_MEDTR|nr:hypothetical protein MtrunA17_Chr2g0309531 [Medicago truncatula]